ncbi:MAG: hypothetical protein IPI66_13370 [Chitinophagaceae bacterium]|nr:hypothetical protein [Chitinophagaceae bacterium]
MKRILIIFLLCPLISLAQNSLPRFEQDTLYTTSGYNIYKGSVLQLGTGHFRRRLFQIHQVPSQSAQDQYLFPQERHIAGAKTEEL